MNDNSTVDRTNSHAELEQAVDDIVALDDQIAKGMADVKALKEQRKARYERAKSTGFDPAKIKTLAREKRIAREQDGEAQLTMEMEGEVKQEIELDTLRDAVGLPTVRDARKNLARKGALA